MTGAAAVPAAAITPVSAAVNKVGAPRPRNTMARRWYQFAEPRGRTVAHLPEPHAEPASPATAPTGNPDLTRVINPLTGISRPAVWPT